MQFEIVWVGSYSYRSQCLDHLRIGSVFFMGDTAKVVSPFGARGGNTGIADADNLAWKLAAVLRGRAPAQLLDSYEHERLQAAQDNVLVTNPFETLDVDGVGRLIRLAAQGARPVHPGIKMGICGEHGGDPSSVEFCHQVGLDYVSCSPFRVATARLAAGQAAVGHAEVASK